MPFTIGGDWIEEPNSPQKAHSRPIKVLTEKRGSSIMTLILNLPLSESEIKSLCSKLKQSLGCGGTVKDDKVELQGNKVQLVKEWLQKSGFKVR